MEKQFNLLDIPEILENGNLNRSLKNKCVLLKKSLEGKLRNRISFLKEKLRKNLLEINALIKSLYCHKFSIQSFNFKKLYFNIFKTKRTRENNTHSENKTIDESPNFDKNFEEFLSLNSYQINDRNNDLEENYFNYKEDKDTFNEVFSLKNGLFSFSQEENNYQNTVSNPFNLLEPHPLRESDLTITEKKENKKESLKSIFSEQELNRFEHLFNEIKHFRYSENQTIDIEENIRKKYNILTPEEKQQYIYLAKKFSVKEISRNYGVPLKSLKRWIMVGTERKKGKVYLEKGGGRKLKDPEMERKLLVWYQNHHEINRNIVTAKLMRQKALELTKCKDFIASKGWLNKFKRQYNIKLIRESDIPSK